MFNRSQVLEIIISIFLVIFIGMRGATPDTQVYWNIYNNIDQFELLAPIIFYQQTGVEIAFGWYSYLMRLININDSIVFFSIYSCFIFFCIYRTTKLIKIPYFLVLFLYVSSSFFYIQQFMQIRQGLATAMAMYGIIRLLSDKNNVFSYSILIFSVFIHQTAVVLVVTYIIYNIYLIILNNIKNKKLIMCIFILLSILIINYILMPLIILLSNRVASYSMLEEYGFSRGLFDLPNIRALIMFIIAFLLTNDQLNSNNIYRFLFFCLVMACILRLGFSDFAILNGRLSVVVSFAEIFIIPMIIFYRFTRWSGLFISIIFFICQMYLTLFVQSPILLETYFVPLLS